ncbi:MAG: hypothetical protein WCT11_01270 [Candidatus Magasanikbacteria bacterium]
MQNNQLDRIIRLVRRTGDRFVIMDKETDETMVMMNLDEYENLLNDTSSFEELEEEDMLNKLNHDISRWQEQKSRQPVPEVVDEIEDVEDSELEEVEKPLEPTEPLEPLEPSNIPLETGQVEQVFGEESLSGLPEGEEEKFYLEPIE